MNEPVGGDAGARALIEAARARALIEESREIVVVLDEARNVVAASRRARSSIAGLRLGEPLPEGAARGRTPLEVRYAVGGREEALLYLSEPAENVAFEELRSGFTAAVSHELRTPLARLLALLESASLPGEDVAALIEQAREEVGHVGELIDDVLFLSELETGRQAVSLGATAVLPVVKEAAARLADSADRAGVRIEVSGDSEALVPLRPRMLRVIVENLTSNAIRYAGHGATFTLTTARTDDAVVLDATDNGAGVDEADLPRLFERFYRPDRARTSRGTGLGLAIVKHVVTAAGGTVEAEGRPGGGLRIRCVFPVG